MEHSELVALIERGVTARNSVWAELGAGRGVFTAALRSLLHDDATIYVVDRDGAAVRQLRQLAATPGPAIIPQQADFTQPLDLPPLDGLLLANALHFVREQAAVLAALVAHLRPGGRVLLVEYDLAQPLPWVPFPIPPARFAALAAAAGLEAPQQIGLRRSPRNDTAMYAAVALRPAVA